MSPNARNKWTYVVTCAVLVAVTAAAYWPVGRHEFLNYDDQEIYDNPRLTAGRVAGQRRLGLRHR